MTKKNATYKELRAELDTILELMQHGDVDIDAAMKAYERGMAILTELEAYLGEAQHKVTKLQQKFEDA